NAAVLQSACGKKRHRLNWRNTSAIFLRQILKAVASGQWSVISESSSWIRVRASLQRCHNATVLDAPQRFVTQRLKARGNTYVAARLKACPDTFPLVPTVFTDHWPLTTFLAARSKMFLNQVQRAIE